jgi:hypothetical protein
MDSQATMADRVHRLLSSTPRAVLSSARKSLFLSRHALWSSGRTALTLTFNIPGDVDYLAESCGGGHVSGLEDALRGEIARALDLQLSDVLIDSLSSDSAGSTQVIFEEFRLEIRRPLFHPSHHRNYCSFHDCEYPHAHASFGHAVAPTKLRVVILQM